MGKREDFIKIGYCIFKIHKPSINFSMKSSYEKVMKSVNTRGNLYICILNEPASSHEILNGTWKLKN